MGRGTRNSAPQREEWLPPLGLEESLAQPAPSPQTVSMPSFASWLLLLHTGYRAGGLRDSDTDNECWSDTEVVPQPPARPREKPLGRSQSLRVIKRKPLAREVGGEAGTREGGLSLPPPQPRLFTLCLPSLPQQGTSRSLKVRTRKKTAPSDMDS